MQARQKKLSQWCATVGVSALALMFLSPTACAQTALPSITVTLTIENSIFDNLMAANPELAAELVQEIITVPAQETLWGYLDWQHQPTTDAAAQWVIRLEQEEILLTLADGTIARDWTISLNHYAKIGSGNEFKLQRFNADTVIYRTGALKPTQDAHQFKTDIAAKLRQQLDTVFLELIEDQFLERIPLTSELVLDADNHFLIVPIRRADIRASAKTLFGVKFVASGNVDGGMTIRAESLIRSGDLSGFMIGRITEFSLPSVNIPLPAWWDDSLPNILGAASNMQVFMADYDLDAAAGADIDDGTILDPD